MASGIRNENKYNCTVLELQVMYSQNFKRTQHTVNLSYVSADLGVKLFWKSASCSRVLSTQKSSLEHLCKPGPSNLNWQFMCSILLNSIIKARAKPEGNSRSRGDKKTVSSLGQGPSHCSEFVQHLASWSPGPWLSLLDFVVIIIIITIKTSRWMVLTSSVSMEIPEDHRKTTGQISRRSSPVCSLWRRRHFQHGDNPCKIGDNLAPR